MCRHCEGLGTGTGCRRQAPGHQRYSLKGEERPASLSGGPEVSGPRFQGQQSQKGVSGITWAVGVIGLWEEERVAPREPLGVQSS